MKGTSFVICIFVPECIFQVGIEILSSVESHRSHVLECISLPFHLHPSLTALCFLLAITPVPLSLSFSLCTSAVCKFLLMFGQFLFKTLHSVCTFPRFNICFFCSLALWTCFSSHGCRVFVNQNWLSLQLLLSNSIVNTVNTALNDWVIVFVLLSTLATALYFLLLLSPLPKLTFNSITTLLSICLSLQLSR